MVEFVDKKSFKFNKLNSMRNFDAYLIYVLKSYYITLVV